MKRSILKCCALLLSALLLFGMISCEDKDPAVTPSEATRLSFKAATSYEDLKALNGQAVTINGYMATSSPVDGGYIFLMNLPYQSCPFCVPNTSQLSNTMAVYAPEGDSFSYTTQAIKVTGTLVVAENEDQPFTDKYGYEFNFKIVDAAYTILKSEELSADMALWQKIADSDVISKLYAMYDYINFVCAWNTYYVNSYVNEAGETVPGYYLYPSDALHYLTTDGAQWNYGYKEGYFDSLKSAVQAVDPTAFEDLIANIEKAEALAQKALAELEAENYTAEYKYVEMFGASDYVYTLNKGEELTSEMKAIYAQFEQWLAGWEM